MFVLNVFSNKNCYSFTTRSNMQNLFSLATFLLAKFSYIRQLHNLFGDNSTFCSTFVCYLFFSFNTSHINDANFVGNFFDSYLVSKKQCKFAGFTMFCVGSCTFYFSILKTSKKFFCIVISHNSICNPNKEAHA